VQIYGNLPPGNTGGGPWNGHPLYSPSLPYVYISWMAQILPEMEEDLVVTQALAWEQKSGDVSPWDGTPAEGIPIKSYICPMDPRGMVGLTIPNGHNFNGWDLFVTGPIAFTCYMGNSGSSSGRADGVLFGYDCRAVTAPYAHAPPVKLTDITDGTSNTILVGERPPSVDLNFGWWFGGYGYEGYGTGDHLMGARETAYTQSSWIWMYVPRTATYGYPCQTTGVGLKPGTIQNVCDQAHYWSLHPGGANFLFSDGSVHFLSYDADSILPQLSTRAGNEPVNIP
jgi:prepilin-type processing-associated H-X9-DG protein